MDCRARENWTYSQKLALGSDIRLSVGVDDLKFSSAPMAEQYNHSSVELDGVI
jgi:hypothetical protein